MPNVTYVSFLFSSVDDKISMAERVERVKLLFNINAFLIFFIDDIYSEWLQDVPSNVKIIVLDLENDLSTIASIRGAGELKLPLFRDILNDTFDSLSFLNSKAELLRIARPNVLTPYIGYIDAGLSKHIPNLREITDLDMIDIDFVSILGSKNVAEVCSDYETYLWNVKETMISTAFFIMPVECVDEWYTLNMTALKKHLSMGKLTWDANIWAYFLPSVKQRVVWYTPNVYQTSSESVLMESFGLINPLGVPVDQSP